MPITTYQPSTAEDDDDSDTMNVDGYLPDATHQLPAPEDEDLSDATDAETANNDDTEMSEAMDKLTLDGEPIKSKRKLFKNFQFLVEEKSGLHVWKSAEVPANLDLNTITSIEKPTKEFIAQHKHRYKSMR